MIRGRSEAARSGKSSRKGMRRRHSCGLTTPQFPAETPHGVCPFERQCYIGSQTREKYTQCLADLSAWRQVFRVMVSPRDMPRRKGKDGMHGSRKYALVEGVHIELGFHFSLW